MLVTRSLSRLKNRSLSRKCARRRRHAPLLGGVRDWLLEERCLPSSGPILLPVPTASSIAQVLYNGVSGNYVKTITITNNSPTQTIYAFLEGEDSRQAVHPYEGTGGFDPYDPSNQEYRGYIGYSSGGKNYAGLPPNSSIQITVPLAFWDSGRINFSTDGTDQFQTYGGDQSGAPTGAPFYYLNTNTQAIFYGYIDSGNLNRLNFTRIYNSFDPQNGYQPTTKNWMSPVATGLLKNGQTFIVTGPGLPGGGEKITIDSSHADYINLPTAATGSQQTNQYVFTCLPGQTITPTTRFIQNGFTLTSGSSIATNGLVMWYHALSAKQPNNDAPFQLTEVTFRGTFYALNTQAGFKDLLGGAGSDDYKGAINDSADYDISFVDTINMPVAMEARNVLIPNTNIQAPFGWVGSGQSLQDFQTALAAFTSTNTTGSNANSLGTYFGSKGYPSYLIIDPGNVKLPAGQNLFFVSPAVPGGVADIKYYKTFTDGSVINEPLYALTSGGNGPSQLSIGGDAAHPSQGVNLGLNTNTLANQFALSQLIAANVANHFTYNVTYNGNQFAGKVVGMYLDNKKNIIGVQLDRNVPVNPDKYVYTFALSQTDYAAGGVAGLWYSWAKYYVDHVPSTPPPPGARGNILKGSNILTLNDAAPGLVPGMTVTGNGIPSGCVILSISSDQKTIKLSEVATANSTSFNFAKPAFNSIVGFDPANSPLVPLSFQNATAAQQAYALSFAQTVYVVMSAWSVSVQPNTPNGWDPLMVNIIGGNLGTNYLPYANTDVVQTLTNMSKSALRGVPDYTSPLYSNPSLWYPDPALVPGGLSGVKYNVYNLDPFVWFIHDKLGLTAYAFALDDDVGNVEGGGANQIDISVGGLNGLMNKDPYSPLSQWGVVTTPVQTTQANFSVIAGMSNPTIVRQIAQFDYPHNTAGTLANGPGVQMGTTAQILKIENSLPASTIILSNPLTSSSSNSTYAFFGPLVFTGTVLGKGQPGDTIILNSNVTDAYNTLLKLGPLQNIQVTGEGIDPTKIVTIKQLSNVSGIVTLQLSSALDPNLISQPGGFYAYTFGSQVVPLIRDPGFEWTTVQNLTGKYNHGAQVSHDTPDWTFTDTTGWAGIAFNNSDYGNPPAPQGVQVGFIQRDSSISQAVTLAKGTYMLSLYAAQRAGSSQSLNVLVDGTSVGIIKPKSTTYEQLNVTFIVGAGTHTITFKGTQTTDNTVFIDGVVLKLLPSLSSLPPEETLMAVAAGSTGSEVKVFDQNGNLVASFLAFDPAFSGGVRVAVGDVNGDGVQDVIVASGPGQAPLVKVIDGTKLTDVQSNGEIADSALLAKFDAFSPFFQGGVNVAFGQSRTDVPEMVVGAGPGGGPHVLVLDGTKLNQVLPNGEIAPSAVLASFYAYNPRFPGGVSVALGDVNGDGVLDVITAAGPGGGPHVKVVDGTKLNQVGLDGQIAPSALLASFYAYDPAFTGGVSVAFAEGVNGLPEIITGAGPGGGPHVKVIDGTQLNDLIPGAEIAPAALLGSFYAFDPAFTGGVRVAAADINADGAIDALLGSGAGTPETFKVVDGTQFGNLQSNGEIADNALLDKFFAFGTNFNDGIFLGAAGPPTVPL
jgi:hypothetical protein